MFGNENKATWLEILRDLVNRGIKYPLIIVSDDFNGLIDAVANIYNDHHHQLCYVHLMRNIYRNLKRTHASTFIKALKRIINSTSYELGLSEFNKLCESFKTSYPAYMNILLNKAELYLNFLKYPAGVRPHIYTTNIVESFNRLLENLRYEKGGHFQSVNILNINVFLSYKKLIAGKWAKPIYRIKPHIYDLVQLFNLKFNSHNISFKTQFC